MNALSNDMAVSALDFFNHEDGVAIAAEYVMLRAVDAAALLSSMAWAPGCTTGTLRCEIYGHSIVWDVRGDALHTFATAYEVLPKGADDYELGNLQQVLAFVLARNW